MSRQQAELNLELKEIEEKQRGNSDEYTSNDFRGVRDRKKRVNAEPGPNQNPANTGDTEAFAIPFRRMETDDKRKP